MSSIVEKNDTKSKLVDQDEELAYSKEYFYSQAADTVVRFQGGKILKFNKTALVIQSGSRILHQTFCGELSNDKIDMPAFDRDTYKLFVDCIMGYESYTFDNSFKIFPIVWMYQIQNLIKKCVEALNLTTVSAKVCEVLNMAVFHGSELLMNQIMDFIIRPCNCHKFVEEYFYLLEPGSVKIFLPHLSMDSYLIDALIEWASGYVEKNCSDSNKRNCSTVDKKKNLHKFLKDNELMQLFKLNCFETTGALCKFSLSEMGKDIFSTEEVLTHLQKSEDLIYGESEWKLFGLNSMLLEEISLPVMPETSVSHYRLRLVIERNKFVLYDNIKRPSEEKIKLMSCKVNVIGVNSSGLEVFQDNYEYFFYYGEPEHTPIDHLYTASYSGSNAYLGECIVKITWTFYCNCRVLLVNRKGDRLNDPKSKFFAKNVRTI